MKTVRWWVMTLLVAMAFQPVQAWAQCNGDPALCTKRFDEVCYVTTHNAFNYQGAFFFPNQSYGVGQQLADGVRALMLDVYWHNNEATVYHSSNWLGSQPLSLLLAAIKDFLDQNPNEVVSIIFESYITPAQMADAFTQAGLDAYLHTQSTGLLWPTLGDLIAANQRLVVFSDVDDGPTYPWMHYVWDYAVETDWNNHSRADFDCDYNRGDSTNSLFILNHFVTHASLGYGLMDSAAAINANPYLVGRAMGCWAATGKIPNFLTVDFYEQGDVMAAKDQLNAGFVGAADGLQADGEWDIQVFPNPVQDVVHLQGKALKGNAMVTAYDLQGKLQFQVPVHGMVGGGSFEIPQALANGNYWLKLQMGREYYAGKLAVVR